MKFHHQFIVKAPLDQVIEFHSQAKSMVAITPPPIVIRMNSSPEILGEGDDMTFTMWVGPFPIRWTARIETFSSNRFCDRQISGPFAEWLHCHSFISIDEHTTEVKDEINLRIRKHILWGLIGAGMRLGLPILFAFRAWKTKKILQNQGKRK